MIGNEKLKHITGDNKFNVKTYKVSLSYLYKIYMYLTRFFRFIIQLRFNFRSLIESMPELWEEEQYEEEYNMTNYVASLNS